MARLVALVPPPRVHQTRYHGVFAPGSALRAAVTPCLTTDGHMMITSGRPPLIGKQALVDAMMRVFERSDIDESWTAEETVISGDLAYQRGTYVVVATPRLAETRHARRGFSHASTDVSPTVPGLWCATS